MISSSRPDLRATCLVSAQLLIPAPYGSSCSCAGEVAQVKFPGQFINDTQFGVFCGVFVWVFVCFGFFFKERTVTLFKSDPQLICLQLSPLLLPLSSA